MTDKAAERSQLIFELGRLLAPAYTLASASTQPTSDEYQVIAAKLKADYNMWCQGARRFATVGGVEFRHELDAIVGGTFSGLPLFIYDLRDKLTPEERQSRLRLLLDTVQKEVMENIDRVPIQWAPQLFGSRTPFAAHLAIRDAVRTARQRVHCFDRYLEPSVYALYLRDLDRAIEVRLVTTKGNTSYGVVALTPAGHLAAGEFANFQLIECSPSDMHDRNLRIDDAIFFLGSSLKDAGRYPTNFAPADATPEAHGKLDALLSTGRRVI